MNFSWQGPTVASIPKIVQVEKTVKKWADVQTNNQYRTVEDIEKEEQENKKRAVQSLEESK